MYPRSALPRVCVALGFPEPDQLFDHARREIIDGESFLEFRLDSLVHPSSGLDVIHNIAAEFPDAVILATCRRQQNHGGFSGSIEEQVRILSAAVDAGARAIDLEIESAEHVPAQLADFRARTCLVISWHNFEGTPAMAGILRRMAKAEPDICKLVTTARKPTDILRVLACGKANPKSKLVLLAMGDAGMPSRILAPAFGSVYTYGAPSTAEGTAPGQISAKQMRSLYRIEKLSRSAKIYGVIADPVRHSMSPAIHNRALQARHIDAVYLPFLVPPIHLRDFMSFAAELPVAGFSVTIPHKQKIVRYLDYVDPLARRIGAVNTVWRKAGRWRGINTDVPGVIGPLTRRLKLSKSTILIAGTGGAARSAAFALCDAGAQVSIVGRTPEKVRSLAKATGAHALTPESLAGQHFDALVHATPVGMFPLVDECFFDGKIPASLVFDMVYNPLETTLLRRAREQAIEVIPGTEMFIEQAAHQFELWSGETAPRALMEKTVMDALARHC
ncbi:MAG: shikimate dehydrogenase [Bryobacteraceae bacterium]|nr:shikimate dehydrogenase [Bryobacteraceae bacterium]